jgi:diguanylate cyclase (GGDEF)-like protein
LRIDELSRTLSQIEDGIPIIVVGPDESTVATRHAAMLQGAFDYFEVPQEFELLIERVQQLISLRQKIDRLRADADLDALTGLANRRRFRSALAREVERFRRYGVPCALLLLDIDYLKAINDKFGHPAGDMVIRQIAQTLTHVSRDNDTAARLGGEEFALLLSGIDVDKAAAAAERLRIVLAATAIEGVGHVSVSIGVAGCPQSSCTERELYAASDSALYAAKNTGRNRVAIAPAIQEEVPRG